MRQECYSFDRHVVSKCAAVNMYSNQMTLTFRVPRNYEIETQRSICVHTQNWFDGLLGTDAC
jgi:hypothetical protein